MTFLRLLCAVRGGCIGRWAGLALGSLLAVTAQLSAGLAEGPAPCAAAYHAALGDLLARRGDDLGRAVTALRASDAALPGRWLYAQALFPQSKKNRPIEAERVCAEQVKVSGRFRCVRFAEAIAPDVPAELTISPAPTAEELRILKALHDLVEARGGVPDVGNNGRYSWLAQRAAGDLKTYISQPAHPALCSGGTDFAEFYGGTLKPLQKRIDEVGELAKKARALAITRVAEAIALEPAVATDGTKPTATPRPADAPLIAVMADSIRGAVPAAALADVGAETTALAALRRAKVSLIAAQVEAKTNADEAARDRVLAAGRAVRMLEAAAYGELYVDRYKKFSASVLGMPQEIKTVHGKACTCGP